MAIKYKLQFFLLFFLLIFSATPLTFNFSSFPPEATNLSLEGDAALDDGSLRLTKSSLEGAINGSVGRAIFTEPFLLRKNSTGVLADFTTSFTFAIDTNNNFNYSDGILQFFIAPSGTKLQDTLVESSILGVPSNSTSGKINMTTYEYPSLEVEFDILPNSFDRSLKYSHVGIDVNSVNSNVTVVSGETWDGGMAGERNNATISYNSGSKNLSVAFTTYKFDEDGNKYQVISNIYFLVDLLQFLPCKVIVGFCASTSDSVVLHKIMSWNFASTLLIDDEISNNSGRNNNNIGLAAGLGVGLGLAVFIISIGVLALVRLMYCKGQEPEQSVEADSAVLNDSITLSDMIPKDFEKGTGPRKFSYNELLLATEHFREEEKLGEGGFGEVYRGFLKDSNSYVAVKKISKWSKQGLKEYKAEVSVISRIRHRNLVQLIGWCHERKRLLLVYEFLPNGCLASHLFEPESLLTWEVRYNIAQGLASGLHYLHQEWEQCVLHRDIKSSNVMLDWNFNAKLADFGLAKLVDHGTLSQTTIVAGTMGYMAMEYVTTGKASKASDVYSFGVVVLEIACGRKSIDHRLNEDEIRMVEWVWGLYGEGRIMEAADPKLGGVFDEKQMERLLMVGLWCAHPDYNSRPLIQQAIQVLNFEVRLPSLPAQMPVAFAPLPVPLSMLYGGGATGGGSDQSWDYGSSINSSQFTSSSTTNSNPSTAYFSVTGTSIIIPLESASDN